MHSMMLVGVGGQGTLLASRVLGHLLLEQGLDVKVSEVHGMSQRGGSVVTYVRWGKQVASPTVCKGGADYIVSFEQLEALRWAPWLKKTGVMVVNTQKIAPMPVITGAASYPEGILEDLTVNGAKLVTCDALPLALQAGNPKCVNVVLLGVLSTLMNVDEACWLDALRACVPAKLLDMNLKAFELGRNACR